MGNECDGCGERILKMAEYNGKSTKAHLKDHDYNDFGALHITARTTDPAKPLVNNNFVGDSSQFIEFGNSAQRPKNAGCRIATEAGYRICVQTTDL